MDTAAVSAENGAAPAAAAATSNGSPQVEEGDGSFDSGVGMSGAGPPPTGMPWPGESDMDREEVVRLMVAALREIGYECVPSFPPSYARASLIADAGSQTFSYDSRTRIGPFPRPSSGRRPLSRSRPPGQMGRGRTAFGEGARRIDGAWEWWRRRGGEREREWGCREWRGVECWGFGWWWWWWEEAFGTAWDQER